MGEQINTPYGKRKFVFHILGMTHLPVSEKYMGCAFTQKIVKMCKMLMSLGHEVYLYGLEGSDVECTEFIQTHSMQDVLEEWGGDNRYDLGYDWKAEGFRHDINEKQAFVTKKFFDHAIDEIRERLEPDHFLLLSQGYYQKEVADALNLYLTVEPGVGYRGSFANFRAFESHYIQNFTYGSEHPRESINGNFYDRVIPNYFEAKDFPFQPSRELRRKKDYFFFIGRLIERKGIDIAVKVAERLKTKLLVAGQGDYPVKSKYVEMIGYVEPEVRSKLMGEARAVFVPTVYLEPFGGVNVEAQLTGTPVLTTDFGVFPDTVIDGVTGFRCHTLRDFVENTKKVDDLDPAVIRKHAEKYLTDNVKWEYEKWFQDLYQLYLSSKYVNIRGWSDL